MNRTGSDRISEYLESVDGSTLRLVSCQRFDETSNIWIFNEHAHRHVELIYFVEGKASVPTGDGQLGVELYDMLVHPGGVRHREFVDLHLRQDIINIDIAVRSDFPMSESFVLSDRDGSMRWLAMQLSELSAERLADQGFLDLHVRLLWQYMIRARRLFTDLEQDIAQQIIFYIQDNYMHDISMARLAAIAHVSPSYLTRVFRERVGMPPMKYVGTIRVEMARRLLKSEIPVAEVAGRVGFQDPKYFSTAFKKQTGLSPMDYRRTMVSG